MDMDKAPSRRTSLPEKIFDAIIQFCEVPAVRWCAERVCLNNTRIFKKDVIAAAGEKVSAHYSEHRLEAALDARRSKIYQKRFFRHKIKELIVRASKPGRSEESRKAYEQLIDHYRLRYSELKEIDSDDDVIAHLTRYYLQDMVSELSPAFFALFRQMAYKKFSNFVKNIKLKYEQDDLDEIKKLLCKEPVFFIPNHISNADHIPICIAINAFGGEQPLIAAGANLFRGSSAKMMPQLNAYKIRREYIGAATRLMRVRWFQNPLYSRAHSEYLRYVWGHNEPFMFYIEGTRSRTGLLGEPKMGIVENLFSFLAETGRSAYFVPVSVSYTIVPEDEEIEAARQGENISNKDIFTELYQLNREYGKYREAPIYLRFGKPIKAEGGEDPAKFIKGVFAAVKDGLVPTWTSRLALAALEDAAHGDGEEFSLARVKDALGGAADLGVAADNGSDEQQGLAMAVDAFMSRGFIAKSDEDDADDEDDDIYRITNPELLAQYANRIR
jgi:1-acyl-sn-glycerol-3-phosphate acyltransferase